MAMLQKKLILVSHDAHHGGGELLLLNIARILKNTLGFELIILSKDGGELITDFKKYAEVYVLKEFSKKNGDYRNLLSSLKERQFEYALCNTIVTGDVVANLTAVQIYCISLIHEMPHSIRINQALPYGIAIASCAKTIIFPSEVVYKKDASLISFPKEKVRILPQGIYCTQIQSDRKKNREKLCQLYSLSKDVTIILSVGSGCEIKGFDIFLNIARIIAHMRNDIHFIWVGNYDRQKYVNELLEIQRGSLKTKIHFSGQINDHELMEIHYTGSDIFLLPSREDSFPSVILEAMDAALPIIAFNDAGGFQDLLRDNIGLLVPYLDEKRLEQEIIELTNNQEKRILYGARSKQKIKSHISFPEYVNNLISCFPRELNLTQNNWEEAKNLSKLIDDYEQRLQTRNKIHLHLNRQIFNEMSNLIKNLFPKS